MKKSRISPTTLTLRSETFIILGMVAALILFIFSGVISYTNTLALSRNARQIADTHELLMGLTDLLALSADAETGQRGFVITGDEKYLEPYTVAVVRIRSRLVDLDRMMNHSSEQRSRIAFLEAGITDKLDELAETIALRRESGFDAAREVVATDRGKAAMDAVRNEITEMRSVERQRRHERLADLDRSYSRAITSGFITCIFGVVVSAILTYLVRKSLLMRQRQEWLQAGQIGLSVVMVAEARLQQLGENILTFLAEYMDAQAGAFYAKDGHLFRKVATYGVPSSATIPEEFGLSDGLMGQAVKDGKMILLRDIPKGYLTVGSSLGSAQPRQLLIVPVKEDNRVNGIIELGFLAPIDESLVELLEREAGSIGIAVRTANDRIRLQNLLEETQRQAEEMQVQGEELRVSNEELEEQSRALKESQTRLEQQQAELEQTNTQLEDQAQLLEVQRDDLVRTKASLEERAKELEQASQYKSDFLANMSHELRTPLNSSLILSKLLADNESGNLTSEQVRYATTIQAAGNDLLTLINDILDLSKIESGHMEMHPDTFSIQQLMDDLERTFQPVADQKGLKFVQRLLPGCPATMVTDRQRLEQVLKNLLSNAMKFTEKGEVACEASPLPGNRIAFTVRDTGIGIPLRQQRLVFEAFQQADGKVNRKYGGTGLGLSISRELTRRLGGEIELTSEPSVGSTFVIVLPEVYDPSQIPARSPRSTSNDSVEAIDEIDKGPASANVEHFTPISSPVPPNYRRVDDDRRSLTGDSRVILVVEDDEHFSRILYDLAKELHFQCLIATTAEEGLAIARQYLPSAVLLDVGLPDQSGLSVLDRLKHDARTRHIPVHVVSGNDYETTAMSLGAVGFMLKPVKREDLTSALRQLEERLAQRLRRILVVEDDAVQLESLRKLLGTQDVETVGARSAAECLEQLKESTFDCMVLDLTLPDATGYSLLETLSRHDAYSFPPVIVYTGEDISFEDEQKLRKYSKSIIIKGAKSPERLLDEVTLFLHQVVAELPAEQQRMLEKARSRDASIEGHRILIVEDDVRNVFALTSILEPRGAILEIARNGREALDVLKRCDQDPSKSIDLVLMDVMMPEMDGITATTQIRQNPKWKKLPVIMLTAKAMADDQERCLAAGANDYMSKPLDVEKLLSLVRVWMRW
ncbi:response regulator [Schlesneria sp. DSM 10557]|uniref:response regulator n=1 Tax=Schlesneria sp. DSM 10557 TaxID=3044399 RepID=UPI00359F15A9